MDATSPDGKPRLGCRSSSDDALSMKEGIVTDGERLQSRDMASGQEEPTAQADETFCGRKTAPAAFLEAAKNTQFRSGRPGCRLCGALKRDGGPCGRLAMRGFKTCEAHGGIRALAQRGEFQPREEPRCSRPRGRRAVEDRTPAAPFELMQLALYRQANQRTRMRLIRAWGSSGWMALVRQIKSQQDIQV